MFHISRWKRPTIASSVALSILALSVILIAVGIVIGFEGIPLPQLLSIASP